MERKDFLERKDNRLERRTPRPSNGISMLSVAGGIALIGVAALVILTLPDIKKYIRISTM